MLIVSLLNPIYTTISLLSNKYYISYHTNKKLKLYMNENNMRLMDTERTNKKNEDKMVFEFEKRRDGFLIKTAFGHLCKKERDPGIVNCKDRPNKYSVWNITSRGDKFIIYTGHYCLIKMGIDKKGERNGNYWFYLNGRKCNPKTVKGPGFFWDLEEIHNKPLPYTKLNNIDSNNCSKYSESSISSDSSSSDGCSKISRPAPPSYKKPYLIQNRSPN